MLKWIGSGCYQPNYPFKSFSPAFQLLILVVLGDCLDPVFFRSWKIGVFSSLISEFISFQSENCTTWRPQPFSKWTCSPGETPSSHWLIIFPNQLSFMLLLFHSPQYTELCVANNIFLTVFTFFYFSDRRVSCARQLNKSYKFCLWCNYFLFEDK